MPTTFAKRHHFVPAFALAKFATPQKRDGEIFRLRTRTGSPGKTTPEQACFVEELYTQDDQGQPDRVLEAFLSIVENYAAPAFERLLAKPNELAPADRQTLAYYLAFQYQRTPVVLEHSAATQEALMAVMLGTQFADPKVFRQKHREYFQDDTSNDDVEAMRLKIIGQLKSGEIGFDRPELAAFHMMLRSADAVATSIANLSWILIEAKEDEFVTSDRSMAMHDPTPKFPWSGHALISSPKAQTTVPISPAFTLCLAQSGQPVAQVAADKDDVREMNLRTYGWASEFIYGRTQEVVQRVRRQAKRYSKLVIRPRTPKQVILEEADPDDPGLSTEHGGLRWPSGLWVRDDDGVERFCTYRLVDPGDRSSIDAAISAEEATQLAAASSQRNYGKRDIRTVNPGDVLGGSTPLPRRPT